MTPLWKSVPLIMVLAIGVLPGSAVAFELNGAWASDADRCDKVFARRGQQTNFTEFPGIHGGGFIVEAGRLRGKFAKCKIKTRKEEGQTVNLIAACATDIMLADVQFVLKIVDDNTMTRIFPGVDGVEIKYHRCPS